MNTDATTGSATHVVVAGGGVAGLETILALRELMGSGVAITLLSPDPEFVAVAQAVRQPFGGRHASRRRISQFASEFGVEYRQVSLQEVDAAGHVLTTSEGERIPYHKLVIAVGARREAAFEHVLTHDGSPAAVEAIHGLVQDVEEGYTRRVAFLVPTGVAWPLPLYELALMISTRAREMCVDVELTLLTPETAPLAIFGTEASDAVRALLDEAGIAIETGVDASVGPARCVTLGDGRARDFDRVVALPQLRGVAPQGIPCDEDGFIPVDTSGAVTGIDDVFAAGNATQCPIKQGGVATQHADAVARAIADPRGAAPSPTPSDPILRGLLMTGRGSRFLRKSGRVSEAATRPLWWPPAKVAGEYLAPYLLGPVAEPTPGRLAPIAEGDQSTVRPTIVRRLAITANGDGHAVLRRAD